MLYGPDPLTERLTLLWHNHFATSNLKVDDTEAMYRQNETLRRHARAPFGRLLAAMLRDPALLIWLDAPANRKGHPNENLARELIELFTLGIGHYTENDVKEAARALTGWGVVEGAFRELPTRHDDGAKTILGRTGRWRAPDLVKVLLGHPATARRLAFRLCEQFLGEGVADAAGVEALAAGLRARELDVGWAVATVLRSQAFFACINLRQRVPAPVEHVVAAARALELFEPPSSTVVLVEWATRLGQDLFYPPNVGGWPGGRAWLTTRSVLARAAFAAALTGGKDLGRSAPLDALGLARRHGHARDRTAALTFFTRLLLGTEPTPAWHARLRTALGHGETLETVLRRAVALILAMPEAQLG
jgi:uncharacterized protein (DUF1800 family)